MVNFKGVHFEKAIILTCVRWYVAYYPLSYRQLEELMRERGVSVDHSTINHWVLQYRPQLEAAFHHRKRPVWLSWRLDATYIKIKSQWHYLYRAMDKSGQTIDFLLSSPPARSPSGPALSREGDSPARRARNDHHRWQ